MKPGVAPGVTSKGGNRNDCISFGFASGVPSQPSHATRSIGHGKTTAQLANPSVCGVCLWHRINHIHQQVSLLSLTKYFSFKKVSLLPHNPMSCYLRFKNNNNKRGVQSLHPVTPPGKSRKSALSAQTSALTCSRV